MQKNIFKSLNYPILKNNMIKLLNVEVTKREKHNIPDNKAIIEISKENNINVNSLYFDKSVDFFPIFYYEEGVFVPIHIFDRKSIKSFKIIEQIEYQKNNTKELVKDKKYIELFELMDKRIHFYEFERLYSDIPDNIKFEIFLYIYRTSEYSSYLTNSDLIKDIVKYKGSDYSSKLSFDNNSQVEVFRGQGTESTSIEEAYSWSTNINTAMFFATRFNQKNGKIYKRRVNKEDVIAYIEDRGEEEVLVYPDLNARIEVLDLYDLETLMTDKVIQGYHMELDRLKPRYFLNPEGIHGVLHSKRVLLLSLLMIQKYNLNDFEKNILIDASLFHDIGRASDYICLEHGEKSFKKIIEGKLVLGNENYMETLRFVIENHCIDDTNISIDGYNIENTNRAIKLLKIFKDIDGLDRVRINDLDVNYLRKKESIRFVSIAHELLRGIS